MPPNREQLDEMLWEYLRKEEDDPLRDRLDLHGKRLENQANWSIEHEKLDATRHGELMRALDGHNFRIGNLEKVADKLEDEVEDTKSHDLRALRASNKRWSDLLWRIAGLALAALLAGGVVEFVHRVSGK